MDITEIFKNAVALGASDIHINIGMPPMVRLQGHIKAIVGLPTLNADETKALIYSVLLEEHRAKFEEDWELDTSIELSGLPRFRLNVLREKDGVEAVFRLISTAIPKPEDLGLTAAMIKLIDLPRGLVLVTGPTGSGKTTTLACLLNIINEKYEKTVITIEDPIEFVYPSKKSVFRQREVGHDTKSFAEALRRSLRQDPDVILVGEMRDLETIALAITAAETGHLCFGTLHTVDAPQTVDRIIDVFPPHQQQQIRVQLSTVLSGVISQTLLPSRDGTTRVAAREFMVMTPAISNLIRDGKTHMIYQAIDTSAKLGMFPLDRSLSELVKAGKIGRDDALSHAHNPQLLATWIGAATAPAAAAPSYSRI
ncbi:MAG: type IV pilus twitching motility protein PilT [Elusimicrobia bacterium]|nr:type IV pilus twitching motility protein PilT [Elusimicrobiota bacterium]